MSRFFDYLADAVRSPREQLSRGQQFVRYSWDLTVHCYQQLQRHRAEGMAAELTYRTIFSLIPVLVLGLVMFRVFGGLEQVQSKVENEIYSFIGVPEIPGDYAQEPTADVKDDQSDGNSAAVPSGQGDVALVPLSADQEVSTDADSDSGPTLTEPTNGTAESNDPPNDAEPLTPGTDEVSEDSVADASRQEVDSRAEELANEQKARREQEDKIRSALTSATAMVSSIDFASIGVFGLLLFIYAAVALADSTEYLFNRVFEAPTQRPIHIRLAIHWSIITLGSGLLAMSLYMSSQVIDSIGIGAESALRDILQHFVAFGASWVLLFLLYALMPNTNVSVRASAIGALVAALLWEAAKFGFQIYVTKAVPYSAIYGSIGLIPLFLFWIYVTWLIVLFGLILTHTLQTLGGRRFIRREWHDTEVMSGDPDWLLPIMAEIAHAFNLGETVDNQTLANRLGLTSWVTSEMTGKLVDSKMLLRVTTGAGEEDALTLAKPAEKTTVSEILSVAHQSRPTSSHPAWKSLSDLKKAERNAANGLTLSDLVSDTSEWSTE